MSKILVLAETGFGKSIAASGCQEPALGIDIEGLPRGSTYFISATSKPLPFRGSQVVYPVVIPDAELSNLGLGRRVITNDAYLAAKIIQVLMQVPQIENIVLDDVQYYMQDYMMEKSLATGWDAPKKAGHFMAQIFSAVELAEQWGKNIFMLAHYEEKKKDNAGNITFKMVTTGQTIGQNINPEGKFDIVLYGKVDKDPRQKKVTRYFISNHDGTFPAKSAPGMLPFILPNDLGFVLRCVKAYYHGEPTPQVPAEYKAIEDKPDPVAGAAAQAAQTAQATTSTPPATAEGSSSF